jgi:hypothetical protein
MGLCNYYQTPEKDVIPKKHIIKGESYYPPKKGKKSSKEENKDI